MAQFNLGRVKGDKGDIGKSFRIRGTWATDTEYLNNDTTIDVINHSGCAYACKITHTSSGAGPNATEWGLLLSNKFDIVDTDTINDPSKLPSSAVTFALGQEIDELTNNLGDVSSQLAEAAKMSVASNRAVISDRRDSNARRPMITIIDDDCRAEVMTKWIPILANKEFKLGLACVTNFIGRPLYVTWDNIKNLNANPKVEILNHTANHPHLTELSEQAIDAELDESVKTLREHGINTNVLVYPYGSSDIKVFRALKKYFNVGVIDHGGLNIPPVNSYNIKRYPMMSSDVEMQPIEYFKQQIDDAVEKNGWLVYMTHSQWEPFDDVKINQIIDYANSKGMEWVHVEEGYRNIGNIIEIGYPDARNESLAISNYTVVDCDNNWISDTNILFSVLPGNAIGINTLMSDIPHRLSVATFYGTGHGFPVSSGQVISYIHFNAIYSYQMLMSTTTADVLIRKGKADGSWGEFTSLDNQYNTAKSLNKYTASTPISEFPNNAVTTFAVNTAGATGFPDNTGGIITTYKVGGNGWDRQEYRKYRSNELWSRYANTVGVWTAWEKISAV